MKIMEIVAAGMYDEDPPRSFGWWIFPDGRVEEMDEAGNHGCIADQWLSGHTSTPEVPYDEAIEKLIELGGVRVATFHGSDSMALDLPPQLLARVRGALLKLLRATRSEFVQYFVGDTNPSRYDYRQVVDVVRQAP